MWALRRASNPLKNRGFGIGASRLCCGKSGIAGCCSEENASLFEPPQVTSDTPLSLNRFYNTSSDSQKFFIGRHGFSSQAGTESSGEEEDDLEDGFSELETPPNADPIHDGNVEDENDDELIDEPELSEEEDGNNDVEGPQNELEISDTEANATENRFERRRVSLALFKAIMDAPAVSVNNALDKWVEEGNDLTRTEISFAMLNLRKRRMYGRALQLFEWLESAKQFDFVERDYASRLDLIAKVRGLHKAENYIEKIPKSFRGEAIYRTLLANCVATGNAKKAEEVFNKMKDLELPLTSFACNQLLLLYKRINKKKIADVLLLMEKENIKPSPFTYGILIDAKGQSNDITGMDQIVETMKAEGVEPDIKTQAILAKHYVNGGLKEKAEAVLKEMEGDNIKENRLACRNLLTLYAALGKADEVGRVWKVCESNPRAYECLAAIEAWGKLNKVEQAEAVFDHMLKTWKKLTSRQYSTLLKVYADHKMLAKGKDLVKQMVNSGGRLDPLSLDGLVKLYVEAGEVEKADIILQKAVQQNVNKPMLRSYLAIMDQYSKKGDIHNTEKLFHRLRQVGYVSRMQQFQCLIQAYINAKGPAYGMRERLRADNIFPNNALAGQLAQVDPFRKTAVSDLLD